MPMYFVKVAFKLPDWMEPLSWIYPLVRGRTRAVSSVGFRVRGKVGGNIDYPGL